MEKVARIEDEDLPEPREELNKKYLAEMKKGFIDWVMRAWDSYKQEQAEEAYH